MTILGWISLVALLAALLAKRTRQYGLHAFGEVPPAKGTAAQQEIPGKLERLLARFDLGFDSGILTSMVAEFLIWTQVVTYWTRFRKDADNATNIYIIIGIAGIFDAAFGYRR
ncbi:MAG: hypothetical protein ACLR2G_12325 [Phascolarctobacterium faecium]